MFPGDTFYKERKLKVIENIVNNFMKFGRIELIGKIIIVLSIMILIGKLVKDINSNYEVFKDYKYRKREIANRIIYYLLFFIHTTIIILGVLNIKLLNINLFGLITVLIIYLALRICHKLFLKDKKDILEIYKDGNFIESVKVRDGVDYLKSSLTLGVYVFKVY